MAPDPDPDNPKGGGRSDVTDYHGVPGRGPDRGEAAATAGPWLPQRIGRYAIMEVLGEGGMGTVYLAEQTEPLRRRVALKLIRPSTGGPQGLLRFAMESEALGRMNHPNIAQVYEASVTSDGQAYIAMEYVPGSPITRYCDDHSLGLPERLDLLIAVCHGVQHAHQRSVLHRDIKPTNVLVTESSGQRVPKLIDFGVAKPLDRLGRDPTDDVVVGTARFLSPEAVAAPSDVDTRSDVYGLGVLLYLLLVGQLPLGRDEDSFTEVARKIADEEPLPPSRRLLSLPRDEQDRVCAGRRQGQKALVKELREDLDWITLKALDKRRDERYGSAAELAEDLTRYRNQDSVVARPVGGLYRVKKFVRRHRAGVAVAAVFVSTLLFGIVGTTRARRESDRNAALSNEVALLSAAQLSLYKDHNPDLALALALETLSIGLLPEQEFRVLSEAAYAPGTRRVFAGHAGEVHRFDLTPDGTRALSGGADGTLRLWDVATGRELVRFEGHSGPVFDAVLGPGGRLALSGSQDGTARLWNAATGEELHVLRGHREAVMAAAFDPTGTVVATGSLDRTVRLWEVASGREVRVLGPDDPATEAVEGHRNDLSVVAFTADGRSLLSGAWDGLLVLWDPRTGVPTRVLDHPGRVLAAAATADGRRVLTGAADKKAHLWDIASGRELLTLSGHTAAVLGIALSPDGETALTASQDRSIRLWNLANGQEIGRFNGHSDRAYDVAFLPGAKRFISSSYDSTLRLWDVQRGESARRLEGHQGTVFQVVFDRLGRRVLSASGDGTARLWNVQTGAADAIFALDRSRDAPSTPPVRVFSAAFSADEREIITAESGGGLCLWDVTSCQPLRRFGPDDPSTGPVEGHAPTGIVWFVAFGPDGREAFSASADGSVIRWNVRTGEVVHRYAGHQGSVFGVQLVGDGTRFLSHSLDRSVVLWDVRSGAELRRYLGHKDWVWSVALSPDQTTFLSASADNTLILWDLETGRELRRYAGHDDSVLSVAFAGDGRRAVSSGRDNDIILWDVASGEWLNRLREHTNWVRSVAYSPVAERIASAGEDRVIRLWDVPTLQDVVAWARRNRHVRELTCEERVLHRLESRCD